MNGQVQLHGHGVRQRLQLGPKGPGERATVDEVPVRRYRCTRCSAVATVLPRGLLPGLRYRIVAVVLALAAWLKGDPSWRVHDAVSPWPSSGDERFHGWRSLRRWVNRSWAWLRGGPCSASPGRPRAERVLAQLAARAPQPTGVLLTDALAGLHFI